MAWRKTQAVMITGDIEFIQTAEPILAFYRTLNNEKMLCVFNLSAQQATLSLPVAITKAYDTLSHHNATLSNNQLIMNGFGCYYAQCS